MTAPSTLSAHDAAVIVEQALAAVLDPAVVRQLRPDSPLAPAGLTPADAVCVADAVAEAAEQAGWTCLLGDADLAGAETVADIVRAAAQAAAPVGEEP